ncbi:MAG: signal recognition particle protein, partial [Firmicutes bacterium]|nr:signal recognition particle protein [Bacillota bacterium]
MAFEGLSDKLQGLFKSLRGKGILTEDDINKAMREVRLALLEADVNFKVVKKFVANVKEKCLGEEVLASLTPGQQVIKIVNEELTALMGGTASRLTYSSSGFTVILLAGLQGTGKTTSAGKLARYLKNEGKKPMMAACDVHRPAAIDQLEIVGKQVDVPVYADREEKRAEVIASRAAREAELKGYNVLIVDTSGRLHVDEELMEELKRVKEAVKPHEILLVVDALTGQDAVTAASAFNEAVGIDGIIMTKLDGDSRGGAALSVREVTGKPIKFIGTGEKLDALDIFHPDRMASRILGMGDVLTLIERAEQQYDEEEAAALEKKIQQNQFTLEDFLEQMGQIRKMGGMRKVIGMLPGMNGQRVSEDDIERSEKEFVKMEAIIRSMTPAERADLKILNA